MFQHRELFQVSPARPFASTAPSGGVDPLGVGLYSCGGQRKNRRRDVRSGGNNVIEEALRDEIAVVVRVLGMMTGPVAGAGRSVYQAEPPPVVGRWDLKVHGSDGDYPSWLEVRESGYRTLVGSFVGRTGSARPISRVEFENGRVRFSVPPQWEKRTDDQHVEGRLEGDVLRGETTDEKGRRVAWEAHRAPRSREATRPGGASRSSCSTGVIWPAGSRGTRAARMVGSFATACSRTRNPATTC